MLTFLYDAISQPCRAVWLLLEINGVPYKASIVKIAKGESRKEEFLSVSPNGTVPAISDGGFHLFESAAIMKYLVNRYQLPDHWYPVDVKKRAKIDEYLSWHTGNLRMGASGYMFRKYIGKVMMGIVADEKRIKEAEKTLEKSMNIMESHFLKDTRFINSDEISIADIQAICEFTQFWLVGIDVLSDRPPLRKWMDACMKELDPHFDKVHLMVYTARDKGVFKSNI